ncbi:hypothetical protein HMPREF9445_02981 [Bacteroides clarus YIT 12056]|uniref:Lipoprotein n=1 Tax=Bacteroides clarus YIT 12056 TaxID=762984 RepID=A0ABN0CK12_9BACE|nr:hypothetical protein HMPREF9445_02981 [Bacteroides clarus YIT 12056]
MFLLIVSCREVTIGKQPFASLFHTIIACGVERAKSLHYCVFNAG